MATRTIKMLNGKVHCFFIKGEKNPCGCGSNCFHLEDNGKITYCVCNACKRDLYEKERNMSGEWR